MNGYAKARRVLGGGVLVLSVALAASWTGSVLGQRDHKEDKNGAGKNGSAQPAHQADTLSRAFRSAAHEVLPSVVSIQTAVKPTKVRSGRRESPFRGTPFDDLLKQFPELREPFDQMPEQGESAALGSGVIIDPKGIILTNNHVVNRADEIKVTLANGEVYTATDVKTDPKTDVAVVWIDPKTTLSAAKLGDSDAMEVGDWVVAIGNPFGLNQTVTAGIISAKGRGGIGAALREEFLQTDAAINPGNSGGPLVNMDGEVVGINTAISSNNGYYQGVGFAIPSNMVRWVSGQLIDNGSVKRSYVGVVLQPMSAELADEFGLHVNQGAIITDVLNGTPGDKAGLKAGDVVLKFDGHDITAPVDLQRVVETTKIGATADVTIVRDGKQKNVRVKLEEQPEKYGMERIRSESSEPDRPDTSSVPGAGVDVQDLTPELAKQLGHNDERGVVIRNVEPNSAASRAGLRPGMLIVEADRQDVTSSEDFEKIVKSAIDKKAGKLLLRVIDRSGTARYLTLRVK